MKEVSHCENSTITEAWIAIIGYPTKVKDDDIATLSGMAMKEFESQQIKKMPSLVITSKTDKPQPAFWTTELSYDNGRYLARTGHQYLSVHVMADLKSKKYSTYSTELEPQIKRWLAFYQNVLSDPQTFQIQNMVFGYTNSFQFESENFNVTKYFKMNIGADLGDKDAMVSRVNCAYTFINPTSKEHTSVNMNITPTSTEKLLNLKTKVFTERKNLPKCTIEDTEAILEMIQKLKNTSKKAFFSFTTEATHKILKVK